MFEMKKFYYFYKITNTINNHFYYGVHSTNNLNDDYMGSGKRLHFAYKKYGIENFKKEILKFFNSADEAYKYESEIVNETLISDSNCYNLIPGGKLDNINNNFILVKDSNNNIFYINKNDERYTSGKLKYILKDIIFSDDKVKNFRKGRKKENRIGINSPNYNHIWIKKNDECILINKNDFEKYENNGWERGRIVKNKTQTISKMIDNQLSIRHIDKNKLDIYLKNGWSIGGYKREYKYKRIFVNKDNKNIIINENELETYLNNGWKKGFYRKKRNIIKKQKIYKYGYGWGYGVKNSQYNTCWITNGIENKKIKNDDLNSFLEKNLNWYKGRTCKKSESIKI